MTKKGSRRANFPSLNRLSPTSLGRVPSKCWNLLFDTHPFFVCQSFGSGGLVWDPLEGAYAYSWVDHGLQSGPMLAFSLELSDFKIKTSFEFPIKEIRSLFLFLFLKSRKVSSYGGKWCFGPF